MDQINAHLSQHSASAQRQWMFSAGFPHGPHPMARRASQPTHSARRASVLGLNIASTDQSGASTIQNVHQIPLDIPMNGVLPCPAPSDDTPQIISLSSTRRQSLEQQQQQPQNVLSLDLDGMSAAIIAHNRFLQECRDQRAMPPVQTVMPTVQTVRLPAQTALSSAQNTMPLAQTIVQSPRTAISLVPTVTGQSEKRPAESDLASQPKRRATELGHLTPSQSASPGAPPPMNSPINRLDWKGLSRMLEVRQILARPQNHERHVLENRFRLLREACELEDMDYLAMHQVFCVSTVIKLKHPASFPIAGTGVLSQLLLKNDTFDKESLDFFSTFPSSFPISPGAYLHEYNSVQIHLKNLEQHWNVFQENFIGRTAAPLDIDIIARLKVRSPILQRIIYRCICRAFWPASPVDNCLQGCFDLFTRYQIENRRWRFAPGIVDTDRSRALESNYQAQILESHERLNQHQIHYAEFCAAQFRRRNSNTISMPPTSVTLAAAPVVPSNAAMHDVTPASMPSTFPSHTPGTIGQLLWQENHRARTSNQHTPSHNISQSQAQLAPPATSTTLSDNTINLPRRGPGRPRVHLISTDSRQGNSSRPNLQPQRHNTLPATLQPQSQARFITQTIPLQLQQQQVPAPSNTFPIQRRSLPPSLFRNIDYTGTPLHPITSTLHQAHLEESPITISVENDQTENGNSKFFHYLDSFALPPALVLPQDRNRRLNFAVSNASINHLAKPSKAYDTVQNSLRPGSQTYRLRCVKVPDPNGTHFDKTGNLWSTLETCWPELIVVTLNDRNLEIRRKEVHGKDHYIEISDFIREGENTIYISLLRSAVNPAKNVSTYAFAVEVLEIKSTGTARQELGHLAEGLTREAIVARLKSSDPDVEVLSGEPIRIPLIDPISLKLIASPVRGATCKHFECFDLESFLSTRFNSASPQCAKPEAFRCPICGKDARPTVLLHDEWQTSVLQKLTDAERKRGVTCVVVSDTGEWKFDVEKHDAGGKGTARVKSEDRGDPNAGPDVIVLD